jgi:hypothetical protein
MNNTLIKELVGTWQVMAEMEENTKAGRRETLRECADALNMLLSANLTEPPSAREKELEELLHSACAIAKRRGEGTAWERFVNGAYSLGINGITARTYRVLPSDVEPE